MRSTVTEIEPKNVMIRWDSIDISTVSLGVAEEV